MSPGLAPKLLGLLPLLAAVRGDCPPPPILNGSTFRDGDPGTHFPNGIRIVYKCLPMFYNVHGKLDIIQCLRTEWTPIEDFCEQICQGPVGYGFANPIDDYTITYYVAGSNVNYECRPAYERIPGISSVITCLQNYTWSPLQRFCKRKSCGHPGNPQNGKAVFKKDFLFLSRVRFICNDGYRLIGSRSMQCRLKDNEVKWNQELPRCEQITCVPPPNIPNGAHNGSNGIFALYSAITYKCDDGFSLTGEASLYCISENQTSGVWNGSVPECRSLIHQDSAVATTVTTPVLSTRREMEIEGTSSGSANNTPSHRIEKKGSQIGFIAGVSAVSGAAIFATVVAAVKASRNIRQKRSSYNLNHGSKSMQLSETSRTEV